jgi:hypothetical protein
LLQNHTPLPGTQCQHILSQWIVDTYWCTCTGHVFQTAENSYSYWVHNS